MSQGRDGVDRNRGWGSREEPPPTPDVFEHRYLSTRPRSEPLSGALDRDSPGASPYGTVRRPRYREDTDRFGVSTATSHMQDVEEHRTAQCRTGHN